MLCRGCVGPSDTVLLLRKVYFFKVFVQHSGSFVGTRWRRSLRHCGTNRKVTGSIPDGVIILSAVVWPWGRFSLQQK